jgi:phage-related baseplate assembly protein
MLTDGVTIKDAFIINIGVNFDIIVRPNYNGKLVLNNCLTLLQSYFNIDKWQINQPIILSDIYSNLDQVDGV